MVGGLDEETTGLFTEVTNVLIGAGREELTAPIWSPHLTFQLFDRALPLAVREELQRLAERTAPVTLELRGLGFFRWPRPVAYVTVVRTFWLDHLFHQIAEVTAHAGFRPRPNYEADRWVPHISLVLDDHRGQTLRALRAWEERGLFVGSAMMNRLVVLGEEPKPLLEERFSGELRARR